MLTSAFVGFFAFVAFLVFRACVRITHEVNEGLRAKHRLIYETKRLHR